jgi:hypothetical protein
LILLGVNGHGGFYVVADGTIILPIENEKLLSEGVVGANFAHKCEWETYKR